MKILVFYWYKNSFLGWTEDDNKLTESKLRQSEVGKLILETKVN
jgi:hypothetical protein